MIKYIGHIYGAFWFLTSVISIIYVNLKKII